jgi:hypothetical protein
MRVIFLTPPVADNPIFQQTGRDCRTYQEMRRTTGTMPDLMRRLDSADARLRRSVSRVRGAAAGAVPKPAARPGHLKPVHKETALDQSIAALQAVVWIAGFVQSIFNEIRGRGDE